MNYTFFDPPSDYNNKHASTLISGDESQVYPKITYLLIKDALYEIKYKEQGGPFKKALMHEHILAVGHQSNFYLFNTSTQQNILTLSLEQYFGNIYFQNELFYIADSAGLYCINLEGKILWHNGKLGSDGVMIHDFQEGKIYGTGEWDTAGGWEEFIIELDTGKSTS